MSSICGGDGGGRVGDWVGWWSVLMILMLMVMVVLVIVTVNEQGVAWDAMAHALH